MDVSGKVHGATSWTMGQEPSVLTAQEAARVQSRSEWLGEQKNQLNMTVIEINS
jgi:hypothetical protein